MALSIITSPPLVGLSGNPVRFKLQSDNQFSTAGTVSSLAITFFSTGNPGDTFTLPWGDKNLTFTCAAAPDNSGLQIPDNHVIANLNDWVAEIADWVAANYMIDEDFTVTHLDAVLTLTAIKSGSLYDLGFSAVWTNGAFPPTAILSAAVDEVARPFYRLGCQLLLKVGAAWEKMGEDILPVDADGYATFDIHTLFADRVYSDFKFPEASDQLMIIRESMCREYKIRYYEQYGETITPGKLIESDSFHIMASGISHLQEAIYNRQGSSYWDKIGYNQYFLSWSPTTKIVDRWTTEKLFYLVRSQLTSLVLKVEINYNDDTAQSIVTKATVNNPINKGVYEIACSLNVLQLAGYDDETIDYYRIWLENSTGDRISEIRTYQIDYVHHNNIQQLLFRNSPGGYDTLRTTGEVENGLDYERTTLANVLGPAFTEKDHAIGAGVITETQSYKANTGFISREDASWIRDFLLSEQVYLLNAGKLIPVLITTTGARQSRTDEDLFAIDFEYQRAFSSRYYSKEIVSAQFTNDFNDDFTNE